MYYLVYSIYDIERYCSYCASIAVSVLLLLHRESKNCTILFLQ